MVGQNVQVSAQENAGDGIIGGQAVIHLRRNLKKINMLIDVTLEILLLFKSCDV